MCNGSTCSWVGECGSYRSHLLSGMCCKVESESSVMEDDSVKEGACCLSEDAKDWQSSSTCSELPGELPEVGLDDDGGVNTTVHDHTHSSTCLESPTACSLSEPQDDSDIHENNPRGCLGEISKCFKSSSTALPSKPRVEERQDDGRVDESITKGTCDESAKDCRSSCNRSMEELQDDSRVDESTTEGTLDESAKDFQSSSTCSEFSNDALEESECSEDSVSEVSSTELAQRNQTYLFEDLLRLQARRESTGLSATRKAPVQKALAQNFVVPLAMQSPERECAKPQVNKDGKAPENLNRGHGNVFHGTSSNRSTQVQRLANQLQAAPCQLAHRKQNQEHEAIQAVRMHLARYCQNLERPSIKP